LYSTKAGYSSHVKSVPKTDGAAQSLAAARNPTQFIPAKKGILSAIISGILGALPCIALNCTPEGTKHEYAWL